MKKLARGKNKYSIRHLGKVVDSCVNSTGATIPLFFLSLFFFPIVKSTLRTVDETKNDSDNPFDGLDNAYDNVALPRAFFFSSFLFFFPLTDSSISGSSSSMTFIERGINLDDDRPTFHSPTDMEKGTTP